MAQRTPNRHYTEWLIALALYTPVLAFYAAHCWNLVPGTTPTGFVQYDMPYYMANAREFQDGGSEGLLYALPFSSDQANDAIYFQPQTALLGFLWKWTGCDPGLLFVLFGMLFGLLFVRLAMRLLAACSAPVRGASGLLPVLFLWGGGLLFLVGLGFGMVHGEPFEQALSAAFRFDPQEGWWFMDLGRNLVFPFEAYYHFLFFAVVLFCLRRRFGPALLTAALLALSHPFTGAATLLMLLVWSLVEKRTGGTPGAPWWFLAGVCTVLAVLLLYHGVLLPRDAEHRQLLEQWDLPWVERAENFVPAYALVGLLAGYRLRSMARFRSAWQEPSVRLLIVWAAVWFLLENHELFIAPHQPLHFTRGYTWAALFLLGAPALTELWDGLSTGRSRARARFCAGSIVVLLLLDNAVWMGRETLKNRQGTSHAYLLSADLRELFDFLNEPGTERPLLVTEYPTVAYLAMVYTPLRSYYSHFYNTPDAAAKRDALEAFFEGRVSDPLLAGELLVVLDEGSKPFVFADRGKRVFMNGSYSVYRLPRRAGDQLQLMSAPHMGDGEVRSSGPGRSKPEQH